MQEENIDQDRLRCYTAPMSLNSPIPVRFTDEQMKRLKAVAERSKLSVSMLVRVATEKYLESVEQSGQVKFDVRDRAHELLEQKLDKKPHKN